MKQQQELIPMETGEYLKSLRMERKLTLADVAKAIILDEKVLDDIEQGKADHIAVLYRKGYIRTYARFLDVPDGEIQTLLASTADVNPDLHNVFSEPPKRNSTEKWLRASSYVLASLLVGTLAWQFTHEAVRLSQNGPKLQNNTVSPEGIQEEPVARQQQEIKGPVNASIAPLGALHTKGEDGVDAAEQAWASLSKPALPEGESLLQVIVSADSWVEITDASGQELEMDLLRGGSDKVYHGEPPFKILLGRASAVRLSLDGEAVNLTEFTRDDVAQLTWPQNLQAEESGSDES
jgi:cytoskeleton protein RodZ